MQNCFVYTTVKNDSNQSKNANSSKFLLNYEENIRLRENQNNLGKITFFDSLFIMLNTTKNQLKKY